MSAEASQEKSLSELAAAIRKGETQALGRGITLVESLKPSHRDQATALLGMIWLDTGKSLRIAISGVPGAGKSTLIDALGMAFLEAGHKVAVLAIDPSSLRSGGSILGDKTRMGRLSVADKAFIRPSPSGGYPGGVARRTREAMLLCEAAGFDVILVETVGVGQSEVDAAGMTDLFLLLTIAGAGDELQGIKRGILEIADLVVVNKADGYNKKAAQRAASSLRQSLQILAQNDDSPAPEVITLSSQEGPGIGELRKTLTELGQTRLASGLLEERRRQQRLVWLQDEINRQAIANIRSHTAFRRDAGPTEEAVLKGEQMPVQAAKKLVESCLSKADTRAEHEPEDPS